MNHRRNIRRTTHQEAQQAAKDLVALYPNTTPSPGYLSRLIDIFRGEPIDQVRHIVGPKGIVKRSPSLPSRVSIIQMLERLDSKAAIEARR